MLLRNPVRSPQETAPEPAARGTFTRRQCATLRELLQHLVALLLLLLLPPTFSSLFFLFFSFEPKKMPRRTQAPQRPWRPAPTRAENGRRGRRSPRTRPWTLLPLWTSCAAPLLLSSPPAPPFLLCCQRLREEEAERPSPVDPRRPVSPLHCGLGSGRRPGRYPGGGAICRRSASYSACSSCNSIKVTRHCSGLEPKTVSQNVGVGVCVWDWDWAGVGVGVGVGIGVGIGVGVGVGVMEVHSQMSPVTTEESPGACTKFKRPENQATFLPNAGNRVQALEARVCANLHTSANPLRFLQHVTEPPPAFFWLLHHLDDGRLDLAC